MDNHEINMAIDLSPHPATLAPRKRYASATQALPAPRDVGRALWPGKDADPVVTSDEIRYV